MNAIIEQIDPVLCEDGRSIWLHGWTANDTCFIQTIILPFPIEEQYFLADEWRAAALPDRWRLLGLSKEDARP